MLHGMDPARFNPQQLYVDVAFPLKHPPEVYYSEQVKRILRMFPNEQIYVYVFTDDIDPFNHYNTMQQAVNSPRAEFACRVTENNHYTNVLQDFFFVEL